MTFPPVIRVFFAIDLPLSAKKKLGKMISQLKKQSKSHGIRWTRPENLHITLHFLAEVQTLHLETLIKSVRENVDNVMPHLTFTIGPICLFPNPYRPRVIVLGITPQEGITALAALIGEGIKKINYPVETRPFRGHLTIGRIKHAQGVNLDFLSCFSPLELDSITVQEVILFRSEPQSSGSKYTPIERIRLDFK